jgi:uncharacterized membrane protein YheB (UPF0754 family)
MNLREQILKEHSKANCNAIVQWVGDKQERFDQLFDLFLHDEYRVVQRSAWPLSYAVENHPKLIQKHLGKLLRKLKEPGIHNAVKRNTVRLLQDITVPKRYQGQVMDICFGYVASPTEEVAVKAFSLTVLANLAKDYPDIIPEIKLLIADRIDHETVAFRARAKKVLKQLDRIAASLILSRLNLPPGKQKRASRH